MAPPAGMATRYHAVRRSKGCNKRILPSLARCPAVADRASDDKGGRTWVSRIANPSHVTRNLYLDGAWAGSGPGATPRKEEQRLKGALFNHDFFNLWA